MKPKLDRTSLALLRGQEAINLLYFTMRGHSYLAGSVPGKAQCNNSDLDNHEPQIEKFEMVAIKKHAICCLHEKKNIILWAIFPHRAQIKRCHNENSDSRPTG